VLRVTLGVRVLTDPASRQKYRCKSGDGKHYPKPEDYDEGPLSCFQVEEHRGHTEHDPAQDHKAGDDEYSSCNRVPSRACGPEHVSPTRGGTSAVGTRHIASSDLVYLTP